MPLLRGDEAAWRSWWSEFRQSSEVLGGCRKQEFVPRTTWTSQPQTRHAQNSFEVSKEHLDLLATMSGLLILGRGSNRSGDIAGIFVEITRYFAHGHVRTTSLLEFASVAIFLFCPVEPRTFGA